MSAKQTAKDKISQILKRDGRIAKFEVEKIANAIFKAAQAVGGHDRELANSLAEKVETELNRRFHARSIPSVEEVQDIVEKILIEEGHAATAKAYILYREQHNRMRDMENLINPTELVGKYLGEMDWKIKENSNMSFSLQGLNNYISSEITADYWMNAVYPPEVRNAHVNGDFHLHDMQLLASYCCGWDLHDLLMKGFGGVPGKVEANPAKHFRSALGQVVNFFYTLQGEAAGAQAFSSFDTYLAPFIRYDKLSYTEVKDALQNFIFNMNIPTRVGFQTPFTNITLDLYVPNMMKNEAVIIGGVPKKETYGEFQEEMDIFNAALVEVLSAGDAKGRVFTFPIPTYNITKDFDWDRPIVDKIMEMTAKYGIPYFSNFVNSDMSPEDARSMCCRLRLDNRELRKRGGGLFGANPLTGSIGVVTINLPRLGYLAEDLDDFKKRLLNLMNLAKESLNIKRKMIERLTEMGLYPYSRHYLAGIKQRFGEYWKNHFNTIGLVGMNEALLNLIGQPITSDVGLKTAQEILMFMREQMSRYQEEDGILFNLEATPAEGTAYRLARLDKEKFADIICANEEAYQAGGANPYYTNSSQLPVGYTNDLFDALEKQDGLQTLYTGGTVLHIFLGESMPDRKSLKNLIRRIAENYHLPYYTISPTFSICPIHGYIAGEHEYCPHCDDEMGLGETVRNYDETNIDKKESEVSEVPLDKVSSKKAEKSGVKKSKKVLK
jgi:ribonucleoside-triphosphate reductase